MTIHFVRFMPAFFAHVESQLPPKRGPQGQPARRDFIEYELGSIREAFSTRFEELAQPIPGRPDYRQLFSGGRTVRAYSAVGQLMASGEVQVIGVEIDIGWEDPEGDSGTEVADS